MPSYTNDSSESDSDYEFEYEFSEPLTPVETIEIQTFHDGFIQPDLDFSHSDPVDTTTFNSAMEDFLREVQFQQPITDVHNVGFGNYSEPVSVDVPSFNLYEEMVGTGAQETPNTDLLANVGFRQDFPQDVYDAQNGYNTQDVYYAQEVFGEEASLNLEQEFALLEDFNSNQSSSNNGASAQFPNVPAPILDLLAAEDYNAQNSTIKDFKPELLFEQDSLQSDTIIQQDSQEVPVTTSLQDQLVTQLWTQLNQSIHDGVYCNTQTQRGCNKSTIEGHMESTVFSIPNNTAFLERNGLHDDIKRFRVPTRVRFQRGSEFCYHKKDYVLQYHQNKDVIYEPEYSLVKFKENGTSLEADNRTREGLCPYCPDPKFYQLKNSAYGNHLATDHGILTDSYITPDPFVSSRRTTGKGSFIQCPVCAAHITVGKSSVTASSRPLYSYLRHFKYEHQKASKGSSIKERFKFIRLD